jgi:copper resistance protein B
MSRAHVMSGITCAAMIVAGTTAAHAQQTLPTSDIRTIPVMENNTMQPVGDSAIFTHGVLDQLEDRWNGRNNEFRYDGQAWTGTDLNKLWFKSEGTLTSDGRFTDGQHEILYDRAISSYFDLQAGLRVDLDSAVTRTWAALGVEGLSLYFFDFEATGYVSDRGRFAARIQAYYDLLITQRLILQPQVELNLYSKYDQAAGTGSGLSDIDTGLRLRYEITRKFAPYIGVAYGGRFYQSSVLARRTGETPSGLRFTFGVRTWF